MALNRVWRWWLRLPRMLKTVTAVVVALGGLYAAALQFPKIGAALPGGETPIEFNKRIPEADHVFKRILQEIHFGDNNENEINRKVSEIKDMDQQSWRRFLESVGTESASIIKEMPFAYVVIELKEENKKVQRTLLRQDSFQVTEGDKSAEIRIVKIFNTKKPELEAVSFQYRIGTRVSPGETFSFDPEWVAINTMEKGETERLGQTSMYFHLKDVETLKGKK